MMWRQRSAIDAVSAGQTVYVVMLVIALIFLCIATFFPTYEYISRKYWQHPSQLSATPSAPMPVTPVTPEAPAAPAGGTGA